MSFWLRVSVDITFFQIELLRMYVLVVRTIELEALQIFKAVVDYGGVTRAAAQLHRVPSNVTTRLKQLEEGLGTKLFHRHSRKLLLSTEGNLLLAYAEQLLRLSSEAELAFRTGKPRGKLRIGTLESTAATRLPPKSTTALKICKASSSIVLKTETDILNNSFLKKTMSIETLTMQRKSRLQ
jgi:hypothetical protein